MHTNFKLCINAIVRDSNKKVAIDLKTKTLKSKENI